MIEFKHVSMKYPNGTSALRNLTLKIDDGEFVFILGHSGSGKSTMLKLLLGEIQSTSGKTIIGDYSLEKIKSRKLPYLRRELGVVFQDFRLVPTMTVYENVAFAMRVIGASKREIRKRVPVVLTQVALGKKARMYPDEISGGEQQRVALARALVNNPSILIADEPTGNIDPELSVEVVKLLKEINEKGTTVLMVTHEHELVSQFDERIIIIDKGRIVGDSKSWGAKDE